MGRTVYVGNLPASATAITLSNLLAEHGHVENVKVITDHGTGRSLGYAFVEMASTGEAKRVIEALDGISYDGREIRVRTAIPSRA